MGIRRPVVNENILTPMNTRTIRFRMWDKIAKEMRNPETLAALITEDWYDYPFERLEVMQSTGLKDKHGKECFEGDIVAIDGANAEVVFYNGSFCIKDYFVNHPYSYLSQFDESDVEIIGNVHEHSHLLPTPTL